MHLVWSAIFLIYAGTVVSSDGNIFTWPKQDTLRINHTADFVPDGEGTASNWNNADWLDVPASTLSGPPYPTKLKLLYSDSGIYCLFHCQDNQISATKTEDFSDLWREDVIEVFLWPDESLPLYFEYELSPLNYELPLLVPNNKGTFLGWRPWHYEETRRVRHAVHIYQSGGQVSSWSAEFFIPFSLLAPLGNVPPKKGTHWRGNFYRIDYDHGESSWEWQKVKEENFHDYQLFGHLLFN